MFRTILPLLVATALLLSGCIVRQPDMANPAAVHCEEQGGQVAMANSVDGVIGLCRFDDGSICDEWALLDGNCAAGQNLPVDPAAAEAHCVDEEGSQFNLQDRNGDEYSVCQLPSESICEINTLVAGKCEG